MIKRTILFSFLALIGLSTGVLLRYIQEKQIGGVHTVVVDPVGHSVDETPDASKSQSTSSLLFVGDIMLDRSVRKQIEAAQDPLFPFVFIADTLQSADYVIANLEGPITDRGTLSGSQYSFRFEPVGTINALSYAGIDLVSLANNHIFDYGAVGLIDTIDHLNAGKIGHAGVGKNESEANEAHIAQVGDARVAFLSYTTLYPSSLWATADKAGMSSFTKERAIAKVSELSQNETIDIIVVLMHWGEEYATSSNALQQEIGRALIDNGADLVVGHHPHVIQEVEEYKTSSFAKAPKGQPSLRSGWIAYSLGNFVFDQYFSQNTMRGLLLEAVIQNKRIVDIQSKEVVLNASYQPQLVE